MVADHEDVVCLALRPSAHHSCKAQMVSIKLQARIGALAAASVQAFVDSQGTNRLSALVQIMCTITRPF